MILCREQELERAGFAGVRRRDVEVEDGGDRPGRSAIVAGAVRFAGVCGIDWNDEMWELLYVSNRSFRHGVVWQFIPPSFRSRWPDMLASVVAVVEVA